MISFTIPHLHYYYTFLYFSQTQRRSYYLFEVGVCVVKTGWMLNEMNYFRGNSTSTSTTIDI